MESGPTVREQTALESCSKANRDETGLGMAPACGPPAEIGGTHLTSGGTTVNGRDAKEEGNALFHSA